MSYVFPAKMLNKLQKPVLLGLTANDLGATQCTIDLPWQEN